MKKKEKHKMKIKQIFMRDGNLFMRSFRLLFPPTTVCSLSPRSHGKSIWKVLFFLLRASTTVPHEHYTLLYYLNHTLIRFSVWLWKARWGLQGRNGKFLEKSFVLSFSRPRNFHIQTFLFQLGEKCKIMRKKNFSLGEIFHHRRYENAKAENPFVSSLKLSSNRKSFFSPFPCPHFISPLFRCRSLF